LFNIYSYLSAQAYRVSCNPLSPNIDVIFDMKMIVNIESFDKVVALDEASIPNWLVHECAVSSISNTQAEVFRISPSITHHVYYESVNALKPVYDTVVLGGTFDYLHPGHKILLSMACWIASKEIIVGVSNGPMLQRKKHREWMQSFDQRIRGVSEFLARIAPGLKHSLVPIEDAYGPTITESRLQAMVVSRETLEGGRSGKFYTGKILNHM
jgi:cytidyltransferase-like protein